MHSLQRKVLRTICPDQKGLIARITNICYKHELNIVQNNEFVDHRTGRFFMRTELEGTGRRVAAKLDKHLSASGYAVIQTTSPLVARQSFWTVVQTIEAAGLGTTPYHANVPSFGEWGYVIASRRPWTAPQQLPAGLKFLTPQTLPTLLSFPPDMARIPAEVNRLSNQVLVQTYEQEWGRVAVVR